MDGNVTRDDRRDTARSDIGPFAVLPVALLHDPSVSDRALRVWCAVASFADRRTGECFPLQEAIAERLGASKPTVSRGIAELVAAGWLRTAPRKANDGTRRKIGTLYTVLYAATERADMKLGTERADPDITERATGARSNARASVLSVINEPENQPSRSANASQSDELPGMSPPPKTKRTKDPEAARIARAITNRLWDRCKREGEPMPTVVRGEAFVATVGVVTPFLAHWSETEIDAALWAVHRQQSIVGWALDKELKRRRNGSRSPKGEDKLEMVREWHNERKGMTI